MSEIKLWDSTGSQDAASTGPTNPLKEFFYANEGRLLHKWLHYFDIYDRHLSKFRDRPVTIVEIGVFHGGSLRMWRDYFGPQARIIGVDIDPRCAELAEDGIEIVIGDQADREFLTELRRQVGRVDVVIDDGGHRVEQQRATFDVLYPAVRDGGVFLVEDLHTNYWTSYGGGLRRPDTFIEHAKTLIDQMHAWHSRDAESLRVDGLTRSIGGMHIYDSVIVFDKQIVAEPSHAMTGHPVFDLPNIAGPTAPSFAGRLTPDK